MLSDARASIPRSNVNFHPSDDTDKPNTLDVPMNAAILNGLTNPAGNDSAIRFHCPTGNCTFADSQGISYSSLGICSTCVDSTSSVIYDCEDSGISHWNGVDGEQPTKLCNYTLPNGLELRQPHTSNSRFLAVAPDDLNWARDLFPDVGEYFGSFSVLMFSLASCHDTLRSNGTKFRNCSDSRITYPDSGVRYRGVLAASCVLHPCVKNYRARVTNGILEEVIVSTGQEWPVIATSPDVYTRGYKARYSSVSVPCTVNGTIYDSGSILDGSTGTGSNFTQGGQ